MPLGQYYMIKNWQRYQHYKDRNPTWIKMYVSILRDLDFCSLCDSAKLLLFHLYLLSANNGNKLTLTRSLLARTLGIRVTEKGIQELIDYGFLVPYIASTEIESCYNQKRTTTTYTSEDPKKKPQTPLDPAFDSFWSAYPKKIGKGAARKAFKKIKPDQELLEEMLSALENQKKSAQWMKENGQFIPNPTTWLNQERWMDEVIAEVYNDGIPQGSDANMAVLRRNLT